MEALDMPKAEFVVLPPYEAFYINSMLFNTQSAVRSIEVLSMVINYLAESKSPESLAAIDTEDVLNHLQNIIVQGAALSRYFWPVRKGYKRRGEYLRKALGVTDD